MPLTVATWNVQNLAEPNGVNAAAFRHKLRFIVKTLSAVDADVIALQEIMDGEVAARIATALNDLTSTGAYSAVNGLPDSRLNRVAFLSRVPLVVAETESLYAWRLAPGESVMRLERVQGERRQPIQTPVTEYHDGSRSWHHRAVARACRSSSRKSYARF